MDEGGRAPGLPRGGLVRLQGLLVPMEVLKELSLQEPDFRVVRFDLEGAIEASEGFLEAAARLPGVADLLEALAPEAPGLVVRRIQDQGVFERAPRVLEPIE